MSKSRSATPVPNLPINTPPTPKPSTSRLESNETVPYITPTTEHRRGRYTPPSYTSPSLQLHREAPSTSTRRPADSPPDEPSSKRRKKMTGRDAKSSSTRSSPSTDSQDELADAEHDVTAHEHSAEAQPIAPVRKKRTRTLTTPHQSSVLHALLAQSRFPTTAMREEVGRAIGLSARKVQIWFQNQRQKARRPRSQSDAPPAQPAQYEPYSNVPERFLYNPEATFVTSSQGRASGMPPHRSDTHARLPAPLGEPELRVPHEYGWPMTQRSAMDNPYPHLHVTRPPTPGSSTSRPRPDSMSQGFSRTLPPLTSRAPPMSSAYMPSSRTSVLPPMTHSAPPTAVASEYRGSASPDVDRFQDYQVRGGMSIPPPFTLQPPPQWDPSALAPRPSTSSWSRPANRTIDTLPPPPLLVVLAVMTPFATTRPETFPP
ncbi:Homeobox domain-containing protein [Pleurotus pulmonarius]